MSSVLLVVAGCTGDDAAPPTTPESEVTSGSDSGSTSTTVAGTSDADPADPVTSGPATTGTATTVPVTTTGPPVEPAAPLPDIEVGDANVRTGVLANGLTYYVRDNDNPGGSAELRLAVNAGSGREREDQAGVAHFLEHMLFNGTTRYPKNELIDVLRSTGSQFGADINAYTDFDQTVYELHVSTRTDGSIDTGLDVLGEWLSAATLDPDEVIAERGVVLEEWRASAESSDGRVFDEYARTFLAGSAYEGRDPIGNADAIRAMTPDLLRDFYDRWYRPDNAAVVVIGEIDVDDVIDGITDRFEELHARVDPAPAADELAIEPARSPVVGRVVDPDLTSSAIELSLPTATAAEGLERVQVAALDAIVFSMIANRLSTDSTTTDAPFDDAYQSDNDYVRRLDAPSIVVSPKPGRGDESLTALLDEFERVRRAGFDAAELSRAIGEMRAHTESTYASRDTRQDADYAETYVDAFLTGFPILTEEAEHDLMSAILDSITVAAANGRFLDRWAASAPHVVVTGPASEDRELPTIEDVELALAALPDRPITPREAGAVVTGELMTPPAPITETSSRVLQPYPSVLVEHPVELVFDNGVTVLLEDTPIADGQVVLSGRSNGGLVAVADADVFDAMLAVDTVTSSGVGDYDQAQLEQLIAGSTAELYPSIDSEVDVVSGGSSTADLESLFQLLHQYMSAPRFDEVAFGNVLTRYRSEAADASADQAYSAYDALARARYGDDRFQLQLSATDLDSVDIDSIERVWTQHFGNAAGWTFALVGDIDEAVVTQLARTYLGTLVSTGPDEVAVELRPAPPAGIVSERIEAGTGDKGLLVRLYSADVESGTTSAVLADVATEILRSRLTTRVREQLGGAYSPYAELSVTPSSDGRDDLDVYIEIATSPGQLESISTVVTEELDAFLGEGPTAQEVDTARSVVEEQYFLYNIEIADALIATHTGVGETVEQYEERYDVLADLSADDLGLFLAIPAGLGRYVEVLAYPR